MMCAVKKKKSRVRVLYNKAESSVLCLDFDLFFFQRYEVLDTKRTPLTSLLLVV